MFINRTDIVKYCLKNPIQKSSRRDLASRLPNDSIYNFSDFNNIQPQVGSVDPSVTLSNALAGVVKITGYLWGIEMSTCSGTVVEHRDQFSIISSAAHCMNPDSLLIRYVYSDGDYIRLYCSGQPTFYEFDDYGLDSIKHDHGVCITESRLTDEVIGNCGFSGVDISPFVHLPAQLSGFGGTGVGGQCNETNLAGTTSPEFYLEDITFLTYNSNAFIFEVSNSNLQFYNCPGDSGGAGMVVSDSDGMCQLSITSGTGSDANGNVEFLVQTPVNNELIQNRSELIDLAIFRRAHHLDDYQDIPISMSPTGQPTSQPSSVPSQMPVTSVPTDTPSQMPVVSVPTGVPSQMPVTSVPTDTPSQMPVVSVPTGVPSQMPVTSVPTGGPSQMPVTSGPTGIPSGLLTTAPSMRLYYPEYNTSSFQPTAQPVIFPTSVPTLASNQTFPNEGAATEEQLPIMIFGIGFVAFLFVGFCAYTIKSYIATREYRQRQLDESLTDV